MRGGCHPPGVPYRAGGGHPPSGGTAFLEKPWEKHQKTYGFLDFPLMGHSLPLVLRKADGGSCRFVIPFEFLDFFGNPLKVRLWKLELKWGCFMKQQRSFSFSPFKIYFTTHEFPYYRHYPIVFHSLTAKDIGILPNERERVPIRK